MAPSFRKIRMGSKRAEQQQQQEAEVQSSSATPPPKDDISDIPAPTEDAIKSNSSPLRRVSPSKNLLDRYKLRSHGIRNVSPSASPSPSRSENSGASSTKARTSAFEEDFGEQEKTQDHPAARPPRDPSPRTERVKGIDFEIVTSGHSRNTSTTSSDENVSPKERTRRPSLERSDSQQHQAQPRRTRSAARRHERVDSHQGHKETDTKDFAMDPTLLDVPQALTIRKPSIEKTRTPSPPRLPHEEFTPPPPPSSVTISRRRPSIDGTRTPSPKDTTDPPQPPATQKRRISRSKGSFTSSIPPPPNSPAITTPGPPRVYTDYASYSTVAVRPPLYNAEQDSGHQWNSDLGSNSRPSEPWLWNKRWTCCQCLGETIVEQIVCSCLMCAHDRCPDRCKVIRKER